MDGSGPALVVVPPWASHLEKQRELSGHDGFYRQLARHHTVVLYDRWGTGLSERGRTDFSQEADVQVLEDLADHLRLRRFALLGVSHGSRTALEVARRRPRHVSHLILYGTCLDSEDALRTWPALRELILVNWPFAARALASLLTRGGGPADVEAFTAGGGAGRPSAQLSARETEVLALVAGGCTNAEVAERLVLSIRTVERHLLNTYAKLGVRGRAEAAARWAGRQEDAPTA